MRRLLLLLLLPLFHLTLGCDEPTDPCVGVVVGEHGACARGALVLAFRSDKPVVADGRTPTTLQIIADGGEVEFAGISFELTVEGAQFVNADAKKISAVTNDAGRAEVLLVFPKAGNVLVHGTITAGDKTETLLSFPVAAAPLRQVALVTAATRLQADTDVKLQVSGFLDEGFALPARGGELVAVCVLPRESADITAETVRLGDNGSAELLLRPHKVPSVEQIGLRVCPASSVDDAASVCAASDPGPGCDQRDFDVDDVVRPVERVLLAAPQPFLRINTDTTVTVRGFSDAIYQERAAAGGAVDICVDGAASLTSQVVLLDGAGDAAVVVRPRPGSEGSAIVVSACPTVPGHLCDATPLDDTCDRLPPLTVAPAVTPASFFAVGIGASVVEEEAAVPVIVGGFADAALSQPASAAQPVLVCSDDPLLGVTPGLVFLDGNGRAQATLRAERGAAALGARKVVACPALSAGCRVGNAGCGVVDVVVSPAAAPARFFVLGLNVSTVIEGTAAGITVAGFADAAFTDPVGAGQPVSLCSSAPESLEVAPSTVFLDDNGRATASVRGRTGAAARTDLAVHACRVGTACTDASCATLPVFVAP